MAENARELIEALPVGARFSLTNGLGAIRYFTRTQLGAREDGRAAEWNMVYSMGLFTGWAVSEFHRIDDAPEDPQPTYSPEVMEIARRAAAEAQRAGYCFEYDRIARAAGLPDRAEIKALDAPEPEPEPEPELEPGVYVNRPYGDRAHEAYLWTYNGDAWTRDGGERGAYHPRDVYGSDWAITLVRLVPER